MRVKLTFPSKIIFTTSIAVSIRDINYGGHVGNDSILSIIHEARLRMLKQWSYTEMNVGGCGLIMADSAIQYKGEAFHGDVLHVDIAVESITSLSFDLYYKISTIRDEKPINIVLAKTGMICFDYAQRKMTTMPDALKAYLSENN